MNRLHVSLLLAVSLCALTSQTINAAPKQHKHHAKSSAQIVAVKHAPTHCEVGLQSASGFNTDGRMYLRSMKEAQARTYSRSVKDQLNAGFLRAQLAKQAKSGVEVTPAQYQLLRDADLRASKAFQQTPEELRQLADASSRLQKLDADFSAMYGESWTNCHCRSEPGAEACMVQLDELRTQAAMSPTDVAAN